MQESRIQSLPNKKYFGAELKKSILDTYEIIK